VRDYAGHPALRGYFVADEPVVDGFDDVAAMVAEIRAVDPSTLAYVNLLPDYIPPDKLGAESYESYVDQFAEKAAPRLLSYDYYPFGEKKDRSSFFNNLGIVRSVARRHQIPFMLIMLAMPHGPYRDPTEAELAWQVFHALAFGARGISYFTYWTPPMGGEWNNRHGLIEGGKRTLHYHQVARVNGKARAIAAELRGFESLSVADSPPFFATATDPSRRCSSTATTGTVRARSCSSRPTRRRPKSSTTKPAAGERRGTCRYSWPRATRRCCAGKHVDEQQAKLQPRQAVDVTPLRTHLATSTTNRYKLPP
jgi:hypothetical protein